jgi:cytoskeletal protein RodZ
MHSVGSKLHEVRVRKGLVLQDISAETRIPLKTLEAIENDELAKISSAFAYRSFARQFAQSIGLRDSDFETALRASANSIAEPLLPGQPGTPILPKITSLRHRRTRKLGWILSFACFLAMLVACSNLHAIWQNARSNSQAPGRDSHTARRLSEPVTEMAKLRASHGFRIRLSVRPDGE